MPGGAARRLDSCNEQRRIRRPAPEASGSPIGSNRKGRRAMILYLHGFRSSPKSHKATLLAGALRERGLEGEWIAPQLPASPRRAIELADYLIEQARTTHGMEPGRDLAIMGSSLGGYYATCLAERWKCRAIVLNPVVYAARDLATQVGEHTMYHSDDPFVFLPEYVDELAEMAVGRPAHPERYYLLAAK